MHVIITIWAVLAAWRWGDWEKFRHYHATMLYMSAMNLFYFYLTAGYILWRIQPDLGLTHTMTDFLYTFVVFPCTVILFLSNYPNHLLRQVIHIAKWMTIYLGLEWLAGEFGRITYDHGWNLESSFYFVLIMFPMLRLHYKRPIIAYLVSLLLIVILLYLYKVPWYIPAEGRL